MFTISLSSIFWIAKNATLAERKRALTSKSSPQDSVDFTIQSMQTYLKRLVQGEAAIGEQVENRRKQLELAEKLEAEGDYSLGDTEEEILSNIEYEDEGDEDDALN